MFFFENFSITFSCILQFPVFYNAFLTALFLRRSFQSFAKVGTFENFAFAKVFCKQLVRCTAKQIGKTGLDYGICANAACSGCFFGRTGSRNSVDQRQKSEVDVSFCDHLKMNLLR